MGEHSYSMVFKFMRYLKHEKSHLPVMVALHELNRIRLALFGTEIFPTFEVRVEKLNMASSTVPFQLQLEGLLRRRCHTNSKMVLIIIRALFKKLHINRRD